MKSLSEGAMTSRRGFLGLVGLSAAMAAGGGLLGGCSAPGGPRPGGGGAAAEDLTPYLQGDKVKPYASPANLPTAAW
ncbi:hypothetical protein ACQPYK_07030 [Streptosporangium sp. CA-135522]|uniref:hypothetical protein n=1 Tax=Streptosporangium sp. CA-135522 TaxID=3240072 RepID=UPI003D8AB8D3